MVSVILRLVQSAPRINNHWLHIEEFELMASDRMRPTAPTCRSDVIFAIDLEERGPMFSHAIDFQPEGHERVLAQSAAEGDEMIRRMIVVVLVTQTVSMFCSDYAAGATCPPFSSSQKFPLSVEAMTLSRLGSGQNETTASGTILLQGGVAMEFARNVSAVELTFRPGSVGDIDLQAVDAAGAMIRRYRILIPRSGPPFVTFAFVNNSVKITLVSTTDEGEMLSACEAE